MIKKSLKKLSISSKGETFIQFIKFGLVGISNTVIAYGIEMLCYYVLFPDANFSGMIQFLNEIGINASSETIRIIVTTILAFFISVTNSFYWNSKHVFSGERTKKELWLAYIKTVLCYGITGLIISPIIKLYLSGLAVPYWFATLVSLVVSIPLNFVLNKFWAYRKK